MLNEEQWIYKNLNFKIHDFYSLIFLFKLVAAKNPAFSKSKDSLHDNGNYINTFSNQWNYCV
jgi:hypothetical protein